MEPTARRILVIAAALTLSPAITPVMGAKADYGKVEVVRDRWGVPHVFAETDAGAMYGLGYATAEDRGFQMHYTLRIIQGRLAELAGDVKKVRRNETALQNDREMRCFGFYRAAKALVPNLDAETFGLLTAYSDGVNDCFQNNRDNLHPLFAKLEFEPEPWTPADCIVCWWHLGQFFATDGTRDLIHYRTLAEGGPRGRALPPGRGGPGGRKQPPGRLKERERLSVEPEPLPPDDSTAVVQREDVSDAWIEQAHALLHQHGFQAGRQVSEGQQSAGPKFSHAWVADGRISGTGSAVLVSEPRTPVANPSLFYEFHIQGKTFNARGVGVAGSPVILIGWNTRVAWGMTALGADQADLFRLKTDPQRPDQYELDGRWRSMQILREQIKVKGGPTGSMRVCLTHLGPVVNEFAFARPGDPPVALKRIPICETDRETIQGAVAMLRARDVHEFRDALAGWRFPSANVVFGDREGSIGFSLIGALPLRSPLALEGGSAAHDGSASKYDWQAIIPHELVPHVLNPKRGCLFSANHRPIGSFYPIPLGIRTGSMGDTLRSWRLRELLGGKPALSPEELLDVHFDTVNPARREIARIGYHLRDVLRRELSPEAMRALAHLEGWHEQGGRADLDVPGAELAVELNTLFRLVSTELALVYGGGESGLSRFLKTVGRRLDQDPKAEIEPLEQDFVDRALADGWRRAERAYGTSPEKWNALARRAVTGRKLGYYESLDGFPSLNAEHDVSCPPLRCLDGATILSQTAQAYSQWVPLGDVDRALSNLPIGSSERPGDPMRLVNYESWTKGELHPAPLSREAVERYAQNKRILSE